MSASVFSFRVGRVPTFRILLSAGVVTVCYASATAYRVFQQPLEGSLAVKQLEQSASTHVGTAAARSLAAWNVPGSVWSVALLALSAIWIPYVWRILRARSAVVS